MTYRIRKCRWQPGAAITLPTPWGPTVYVKRLPLDPVLNSDGALRRHEEEHVRQIWKMGGLRYLATQVWARIVTRNFWGHGHWIEDDAYRAQTL